MTPITSANNSTLKLVSNLKRRRYRDKEGLYLLEGGKLLRTALSARAPLARVLVRHGAELPGDLRGQLEELRVPLYQVASELWSQATSTTSPPSVVTLAEQRYRPLDELLAAAPRRLLVSDRLQDPGNLGTAIRTAAALGFDGAIEVKGSVDRYHPRAVRASAGNHLFLDAARSDSLEETMETLQGAGVQVICGDAHGGEPVLESAALRSERLALVVANEGQGFEPGILERASAVVRIPMRPGVESLNAAAAFAILAWEACRARS